LNKIIRLFIKKFKVNELNGDGEHQNGSNVTNRTTTTMSNGDSSQQDDPDNIPWAQRIRDKQQDKGNDEVPDDNIPWAQRMRKNKADNGIDQSSEMMEMEITETTRSSKGKSITLNKNIIESYQGTETTTRSSKRISTTATTSSSISQKSRKTKAAESSGDEEEEYKPEVFPNFLFLIFSFLRKRNQKRKRIVLLQKG